MRLLREETGLDYAAIRQVNRLAFGSESEAQLVDQLRSDGLVTASIVAEEDGELVGHILFSELLIETAHGAVPAVALAPMAVKPEWQRKGIGSALIKTGLELCRHRGKLVVAVVGHPAYYPRFGFSARAAQGLQGPFTGDAWMALELVTGTLQDIKGIVTYPEAFGLVDH